MRWGRSLVNYRRCFYDTLESTPEPYPEELNESEKTRRGHLRAREIQENRRVYTKAELQAMPMNQFEKLGPLMVIEVIKRGGDIEIRYISNIDHRIPSGLQTGEIQYLKLVYEVFDE
jgi:hypothetical protein